MQLVVHNRTLESFELCERAAANGHEESIWITNVVRDVEMEWDAIKEAFAQTEEPLGWYFAGMLSEDEREQFDFFKKSAEGGCSWSQVEYGAFFFKEDSIYELVEKDEKVYFEWQEKAAKQNNPEAMHRLGMWFRDDDEDHKAVSYCRSAAELGWKSSMDSLPRMLRRGEGCEKDLRQAAIWSVKGDGTLFWDTMRKARESWRGFINLDYDFDQMCYSLGWGFYWYEYGSNEWNIQHDGLNVFGNRCLDYYCSCVELQQRSIFTFLWFWNRTTGIKGPGWIIAQMVWEEREDNLVKLFEENNEEEPEMKRIKK
jgi:hypothetical protein